MPPFCGDEIQWEHSTSSDPVVRNNFDGGVRLRFLIGYPWLSTIFWSLAHSDYYFNKFKTFQKTCNNHAIYTGQYLSSIWKDLTLFALSMLRNDRRYNIVSFILNKLNMTKVNYLCKHGHLLRNLWRSNTRPGDRGWHRWRWGDTRDLHCRNLDLRNKRKRLGEQILTYTRSAGDFEWRHLFCDSEMESLIDGECLTWWRHQMETFSALLALCAGNSSVTLRCWQTLSWV